MKRNTLTRSYKVIRACYSLTGCPSVCGTHTQTPQRFWLWWSRSSHSTITNVPPRPSEKRPEHAQTEILRGQTKTCLCYPLEKQRTGRLCLQPLTSSVVSHSEDEVRTLQFVSGLQTLRYFRVPVQMHYPNEESQELYMQRWNILHHNIKKKKK